MTRLTLQKPEAVRLGIPPLICGDRLSQPEFHRRYEAMAEGVKFELIAGTVYLFAPDRFPEGDLRARLVGVLGFYCASCSHVDASSHATLILGRDSELQPDMHLRLKPEAGGRTRLNKDCYLVGPPELVVEVAHGEEAIELHAKRLEFARAGVREYLVFCLRERILRAFDLKARRRIAVGPDGVYRSKVFPGLWFDVAAAFAADTRRVLRVARKGQKSPEHAVFVERLKSRAAATGRRRRG